MLDETWKWTTGAWFAACLAGSGCYVGADGLAEDEAEGEGDETAAGTTDDAPPREDDPDDDEGPGEDSPSPRGIVIGDRPPEITDPGPQRVDEDTWLHLPIVARDPDGGPVAVRLLGLPPGAVWNPRSRRLHFRPDFIQGGQAWTVTIVAESAGTRRTLDFEVEAVDTIAPPEPSVVDTSDLSGYTRLEVVQVTDDYLDSPGNAGREFKAYVTLPDDATLDSPMPVRIFLHGIGASPATGGSTREFRIEPHDPDSTYWWGYDSALPDGEPRGEDVPDYTLRRTLHLLAWLLERHPEADPERVMIRGSSMGGAGAMTMGLWHARHFAVVHSVLGQAIPANHRPSRRTQLAKLWGPTESPIWDALDLTRVIADSAEARDQFLFIRHGKDDPTIHFGAAVLPSPLTDDSLYGALQGWRVGHLAVWDEGAHGPYDPVLGGYWWDDEWSTIHDEVTFLRRDLAFPAFSRASHDRDPGDGGGNGEQSWSDNAGYAGDVDIPGDTGWNGDIAGALNRFLRWDAAATVDTLDRFAIPLRVHDGPGEDAPAAGYPSVGDRFDGELPVRVDVTPRRVQAFRASPGEVIGWAFGDQRGEVVADVDGAITVPALPLTFAWQTLELARVQNVSGRSHAKMSPGAK